MVLFQPRALHDGGWRQSAKVAIDRDGAAHGEIGEWLLDEAAGLRGERKNAAFPSCQTITEQGHVVIPAIADTDHCSGWRSPDGLNCGRDHGTLAFNKIAFNACMRNKSSLAPKPVVTYPALVGKIIADQRAQQKLKQGDLAVALGLSQSAYSRLEAGESVLNLSQLRDVCAQLKLQPAQVLSLADRYELQLRQQNVDVISEKAANPAAIGIGLALLAALLLSGR